MISSRSAETTRTPCPASRMPTSSLWIDLDGSDVDPLRWLLRDHEFDVPGQLPGDLHFLLIAPGQRTSRSVDAAAADVEILDESLGPALRRTRRQERSHPHVRDMSDRQVFPDRTLQGEADPAAISRYVGEPGLACLQGVVRARASHRSRRSRKQPGEGRRRTRPTRPARSPGRRRFRRSRRPGLRGTGHRRRRRPDRRRTPARRRRGSVGPTPRRASCRLRSRTDRPTISLAMSWAVTFAFAKVRMTRPRRITEMSSETASTSRSL